MTKARIGFAIIQVSLVGAICSVGAGIVAPDFSARGTRVEESRFLADLQTVRCQLELYKIQHNEQLPPTQTYASFESSLTTKSADNCGPYLQTIPPNPFNGNSTVRFEACQSTAGSGKAGWVLNLSTGIFQADDSANHAAL
jgi:general secretion pathway protein G